MRRLLKSLYNGYFKYVFKNKRSDNTDIESIQTNSFFIMSFLIFSIVIYFDSKEVKLHNFLLFYSIVWICLIPIFWKGILNNWVSFTRHFRNGKEEWTLGDKSLLTEFVTLLEIILILGFVLDWELILSEGTIFPKVGVFSTFIILSSVWAWYKSKKAKRNENKKKKK